MTTTTIVDSLIREAMETGIVHGLIPRDTAEVMRVRLAEMTSNQEPDDCPVCILRALTEGEPKSWFPSEPASVNGVVLQYGRTASRFTAYVDGNIPFVDLWPGGTDRVRILGYGSLGRELDRLAPTVGDTLTVAYTGQGTIERGKYAGRAYRAHTVEIKRGHH